MGRISRDWEFCEPVTRFVGRKSAGAAALTEEFRKTSCTANRMAIPATLSVMAGAPISRSFVGASARLRLHYLGSTPGDRVRGSALCNYS
jgi:hypothetical protein